MPDGAEGPVGLKDAASSQPQALWYNASSTAAASRLSHIVVPTTWSRSQSIGISLGKRRPGRKAGP